MNKKSTSFKLEAAVAVFAGLFLTVGIFSVGFVGNTDNVRAESVGIQQTPTPKTKNKPAPRTDCKSDTVSEPGPCGPEPNTVSAGKPDTYADDDALKQRPAFTFGYPKDELFRSSSFLLLIFNGRDGKNRTFTKGL